MITILTLVLGLNLGALAPSAQPAQGSGVSPPAAKSVPGVPGAPGAPANWLKTSEKSPDLLDVDFPGGSLADFYRGVGATAQAKSLLPLVISERAEHVRLQPISMACVDVSTLYHLPPKLLDGVALDALHSTKNDGTPEWRAFVVGVAPGLTEAPVKPAATFNLDFPGGTVADYAAAVRAACPNANIVITGDAAMRPVPAMQFREVTLATAMEALGGHDDDPSGGTWRVFVDRIGHEGAPESVYKVVGDVAMPDFGVVQPFDLGHILRSSNRKAADVLSAVEAAMSMYPAVPTLKYHEATQTLLVRGSDEQQKTVARLLSQLQSAPVEPPAP